MLYDGVCNLCNAAVQFIINRDPRARFRFAALSSPYALRLLQAYNLTVKAEPDSIVLIQNGKAYLQSGAALRIAKGLGGVWPFLYVFIWVPPFIRNAVYGLIARNRYHWFGKQESCLLPTPELKARFRND